MLNLENDFIFNTPIVNSNRFKSLNYKEMKEFEKRVILPLADEWKNNSVTQSGADDAYNFFYELSKHFTSYKYFINFLMQYDKEYFQKTLLVWKKRFEHEKNVDFNKYDPIGKINILKTMGDSNWKIVQ